MNNAELTKVAQEVVLEGRMPAKAVAQEIGKPYPTLMRELNPYDNGAKLGAETLIEIMQVTGSVEPLEQMARMLGYELIPAHRSSVADSLVRPLDASKNYMMRSNDELQQAI